VPWRLGVIRRLKECSIDPPGPRSIVNRPDRCPGVGQPISGASPGHMRLGSHRPGRALQYRPISPRVRSRAHYLITHPAPSGFVWFHSALEELSRLENRQYKAANQFQICISNSALFSRFSLPRYRWVFLR
jgi:hypothetical protein